MSSIQRSESVFLRATRKSTGKLDTMISSELKALSTDAEGIQELLTALSVTTTDGVSKHLGSMTAMVSQLANRLKSLSVVVKEQSDRCITSLAAQNKAMEEFAVAEAEEMKKTAEDMIKVRRGVYSMPHTI